MRMLARIGCTLAGLALVAPAVAQAGVPNGAPGPYNSGVKAKAKKKAKAPERLCAECQRQKTMKETKAHIPPPPPLPPGTPLVGGACTHCGRRRPSLTATSRAPRPRR